LHQAIYFAEPATPSLAVWPFNSIPNLCRMMETYRIFVRGATSRDDLLTPSSARLV
jgi:hypothetical protein